MRSSTSHTPVRPLTAGRLSLRLCWQSAWIVLLFLYALSTSAEAQFEYELAGGDVVAFDFLDDDQEPRQLLVSADGVIQLPLLGGLRVQGMVISDAIAEIKSQYIKRHLLVDPKIALSIAVYRPIFVLGDVRTPGSFPFQPLLTVEQAVGLAGGPVSALSSEGDRILAREKLRSEIEEINSSLAREFVWQARLTAQMEGLEDISLDGIPAAVRAHLNSQFLQKLQEVEQKIMRAEAEAFQKQKALMTDGIAEAEREYAFLEEIADNYKAAIAFAREELERGRSLLERGLKTASEVSALERLVSAEEARLLEVFAQMSRARRGSGDLRRALADLEDARKRDDLLRLQERQVEVEKLTARRRAVEDQLILVGTWASAEARTMRDRAFRFEIRRRQGEDFEETEATSTTTMAPGDVLIVTLAKEAVEPLVQ